MSESFVVMSVGETLDCGRIATAHETTGPARLG